MGWFLVGAFVMFALLRYVCGWGPKNLFGSDEDILEKLEDEKEQVEPWGQKEGRDWYKNPDRKSP